MDPVRCFRCIGRSREPFRAVLNRRTGCDLGLEGPCGRPVPLTDQVHELMQLWRGGDQGKVNGCIDERGLQRNALFAQILQALSNHIASRSEVRSLQYRLFV